MGCRVLRPARTKPRAAWFGHSSGQGIRVGCEGPRGVLSRLDSPPCLKTTLLGGFQEDSFEPTSVVSERLEDEVQVCNPAGDLPGRLQLLRELKCDQEEDEEAEEDPEPTWLAPVYCI